MSFSSDCREELCRVACDKPCCRLSELAALYMTLGSISLLGRGLGASEIANELQLSVRTVETYCARIYDKLELSGMKELRRFAMKNFRHEAG